MLQPKRTKYRKQHKGRNEGLSWNGNAVSFGEYGLKATAHGQLPPGTLDVIQVVVADADAALAQLRAVGVDAEGVEELDWGRFVSFRDPDGNRWALQELVPYG